MSDENKFDTGNDNERLDSQESIEQILKDFQIQKERKDRGEELAPPVRYRESSIDFAKNPEDDKAEENIQKPVKKRIHKPKKERKKLNININYKKVIKIAVIILAAAAVIIAAVFGIRYGVNQSKSAYLKPYEKKYPGVEFPVGIMEKYCDIYGENPTAVGYINISEAHLNSPVLSREEDSLPYAEKNNSKSNQFNYVVYLHDNSLEKYYSSAQAYNDTASGFISYSDLYNEYRFKVVGAFYTNTQPEDDNGYIFPYNVTEELTAKSYSDFFDRLSSRFIYDTGITLTRQDKLLTVSCPTDYREGFRFVVVGVLRNESNNKPTATEKPKIHYPQVIYDENNQENPYALAYQWYPEIVEQISDGKTQTKKQSIKDYKQNK
ncbi:MAG: hypothetical protein ACI4XC_08175 [Eubacterium sp.]